MEPRPVPIDLGEYLFEPASGELSRVLADGRREVHRLPPQPARLLALLAARRGEVVSREEIRDALWPDVQVDFDQGLHFCVRQVREALNDTAAASRYVETLPRRGYRLVVPRAAVDGVRSAGRHRPRPGGWIAVGGLVATVLLAVLWAATDSRRLPDPAAATAVRVAILPFRPPPGTPAAEGHAVIAERVLLRLEETSGGSTALIGPTTTGAYADRPEALRRLVEDLDPRFIVHGRYLVEPNGIRLLGEMIRASDGAHVWVEPYDRLDDPERIAVAIADGVARRLRLEQAGPRERSPLDGRGDAPAALADRTGR